MVCGRRMIKYMVVIERGESSWGAHVPDLPGCIAVAETRDEVISLIREAIVLHIDSFRCLDTPFGHCSIINVAFEEFSPRLGPAPRHWSVPEATSPGVDFSNFRVELCTIPPGLCVVGCPDI